MDLPFPGVRRRVEGTRAQGKASFVVVVSIVSSFSLVACDGDRGGGTGADSRVPGTTIAEPAEDLFGRIPRIVRDVEPSVVGDVILTVGGKDINSLEEFLAELRRHNPGDRLEVNLVRDGQRLTVVATLKERARP